MSLCLFMFLRSWAIIYHLLVWLGDYVHGYYTTHLEGIGMGESQPSFEAVAELARNFSWGKTHLWSSGARRLASGAHRLAGVALLHHQRRSRPPALGPGLVPRSSAAGQPGRLWPRRLDATMLQSEEAAGGGGPEAGSSEPEARRRRGLERGRGAAACRHGEVGRIRDCRIGDLGELLLGPAVIGLTGPLFLSHFVTPECQNWA